MKLESTFADRIEEKDHWVRKAQEDVPFEPLAAPEPPVDRTVSEVRPTQQLVKTEPVELPVRKTGGWLIALGALAAVGAGAAGLLLLESEESSADVVPPSPPSAAEEPTTTEVIPSGVEPPELVVAAEPPADDIAEPEPPRRRRRARPQPRGVDSPLPEPPTRVAPIPAAAPRPLRIVHPGGGWAAVRIDGRERSNTPTTVPGVSVGRHLVEIRPYGQGTWTRHPVVVPAGEGAHVVRLPLPDP